MKVLVVNIAGHAANEESPGIFSTNCVPRQQHCLFLLRRARYLLVALDAARVHPTFLESPHDLRCRHVLNHLHARTLVAMDRGFDRYARRVRRFNCSCVFVPNTPIQHGIGPYPRLYCLLLRTSDEGLPFSKGTLQIVAINGSRWIEFILLDDTS